MDQERDKILERINKTAVPPVSLPDIPDFATPGNLTGEFQRNIETNKGIVTSEEELNDFLSTLSPERVYSSIDAFNTLARREYKGDPGNLADLEAVILRAEIGVAENGALWLTEFPHRIIPFIARHLIVRVDREAIVGNMHEAYKKIGAGPQDFGVFVAGPSKTADIEQTLVIGAHGAVSLRVLIR